MGIAINKEFLIKMPQDLYVKIKKICDKEYKSMPTLIRELLLEKIHDSLSKEELVMLEKSRKDFKAGKGISWRSVKRG